MATNEQPAVATSPGVSRPSLTREVAPASQARIRVRAGGGGYCIGSPKNPTHHGPQDDSFVYDPSVRETWHDRWAHLKWNTKAGVCAAVGPFVGSDGPLGCSEISAAFYDHYLHDNGEDVDYDLSKAYAEDESIRDDIDAETYRAQRAAEELFQTSGTSAFEMTGDNHNIGYNPATASWQKALGSYDLWGSAKVTVDNGVATMTFTAHAEDRYNFNRGASDIATGTPDDVNGRFAALGWAHGFNTHGTTTRTVTWTVGSMPTTTKASVPTYIRTTSE
ncbi:hypothetical protein [Dactylosporangium sp. NPDC051484]|uniref:hypothetical protein n=1 Tax=Dactylosporangium sp. NPDC051484 TaxID=3154942 RepID=UPI00344F9EFE